jgi:hypothetical protein
MRTPARCFAALAVVALSARPVPAHGQVNTEPFRKRIKQKGVSFFVQGTVDGNTGNTQGLTADGLIGGGFARGHHLVFALASSDYSKLNGTLGVDKSFAHVRYDYAIFPWLSWEVFIQAQSDVFQRIKDRDLLGTGPRFTLYEDPHLGMFLGVAYMVERDIYDVAPGGPDAGLQEAQRISAYLTAHATLSDGIDTVTTTYLQPEITDPSNIRVLSESSFIFKVSTRLATSISFVAHYDSSPPPGVLTTDTELKSAITLTL